MYISKASAKAIIEDERRREKRQEQKEAMPGLLLAVGIALSALIECSIPTNGNDAKLLESHAALIGAVERFRG